MISYAICTHNEGVYITNLLNLLLTNINRDYTEIVILDDDSSDPETLEQLNLLERYPFCKVVKRKYPGNFSEHKNYLNSLCKGEWIVNLDADEIVTPQFINVVPELISKYPDVEAYWVPRMNVVNGLTQSHVDKWGWRISFIDSLPTVTKVVTHDELMFLRNIRAVIQESRNIETGNLVTYKLPLIMWPDWQMRIYKNKPEIRWKNKVHEVLDGYSTFARFPENPDFAILHMKEIERQEKQNEMYSKMGV